LIKEQSNRKRDQKFGFKRSKDDISNAQFSDERIIRKKGTKISNDHKLLILSEILVNHEQYSVVAKKYKISMASISKLLKTNSGNDNFL
jgi:hypothetical protein